MALSKRELAAARRGVRAHRGAYGPDIRLVRSNAAEPVSGSPRGDSAERGSALAGIVSHTDYRAAERKLNTNARGRDGGMAMHYRPGASASFDLRSRSEKWTPNHQASTAKPRVTAVSTPVSPNAAGVIRMGEFE